jgi:hypothetical protein
MAKKAVIISPASFSVSGYFLQLLLGLINALPSAIAGDILIPIHKVPLHGILPSLI